MDGGTEAFLTLSLHCQGIFGTNKGYLRRYLLSKSMA